MTWRWYKHFFQLPDDLTFFFAVLCFTKEAIAAPGVKTML